MIVEVLSIEDGGFYVDENVSGSVDDVILRCGDEVMKCEGILIWEDFSEKELEEILENWNECFYSGEEGFFKWDYKSEKWIEGKDYKEEKEYDFSDVVV